MYIIWLPPLRKGIEIVKGKLLKSKNLGFIQNILAVNAQSHRINHLVDIDRSNAADKSTKNKAYLTKRKQNL